MSIKDEALRRIGGLPDGCTWMDVLRAVAAGAGGTLVAVTDAPEEMAALRRNLDVVVERDADGWYVGSVPALQGCHAQARTVEELMARVREAVELCLESAGFRPALIHPDTRKMN